MTKCEWCLSILNDEGVCPNCGRIDDEPAIPGGFQLDDATTLQPLEEDELWDPDDL